MINSDNSESKGLPYCQILTTNASLYAQAMLQVEEKCKKYRAGTPSIRVAGMNEHYKDAIKAIKHWDEELEVIEAYQRRLEETGKRERDKEGGRG